MLDIELWSKKIELFILILLKLGDNQHYTA
jgi:hypothetical protein